MFMNKFKFLSSVHEQFIMNIRKMFKKTKKLGLRPLELSRFKFTFLFGFTRSTRTKKENSHSDALLSSKIFLHRVRSWRTRVDHGCKFTRLYIAAGDGIVPIASLLQ